MWCCSPRPRRRRAQPTAWRQVFCLAVFIACVICDVHGFSPFIRPPTILSSGRGGLAFHPKCTGITALSAHSTTSAAIGLAASSFVGLSVDNWVPNTGILASMVVSAVLSNLGLVPRSSPLYDLCWTLFLPASLAFLLLGFSNDNRNNLTAWETIRAVALPFGIASVASILGCLASYGVAGSYKWLPWVEAKVAASCLCASYVGGTVNFLATARIVDSGLHTELIGSLAGVDILIMAIYFCFMAASLQSKRIRAFFPGSQEETLPDEILESSTITDDRKDEPTRTQHPIKAAMQKVVAFPLVSLLSFGVVQMANVIERWTASVLPGLACAVIAIVAPAISRSLSSRKNTPTLWTEMQKAAIPLSGFCFSMLFASLGALSNLSETIQHGPACLLFSALALMIHIGLTFVISSLCRVQLESVLVASNAAIGGPATAATFVGRTMQQHRNQHGLAMAATFWGVVGYAVGTFLGVGVYRILS